MSTDNATKTDLLSLQDRLNKLDAMADNPWKYNAVEWDEAYADAQYEARACKGMAMGAQAHDIAERFKRAGKRFHACAAFNLVPAERAISLSVQVPAMPGAVSIGTGDTEPWTGKKLWNVLRDTHKNEYSPWGGISDTTTEIMERLAVILNGKPVSIGPGDPLPPPPPPTKAVEWTGALVFERIAPRGLTNPVGYRAATPEEQAELDRMARAINRNTPPYQRVYGEALYAAMQSVDGGKLNRAMSCAWVMLSDATRDYYNAVAAKLSP